MPRDRGGGSSHFYPSPSLRPALGFLGLLGTLGLLRPSLIYLYGFYLYCRVQPVVEDGIYGCLEFRQGWCADLEAIQVRRGCCPAVPVTVLDSEAPAPAFQLARLEPGPGVFPGRRLSFACHWPALHYPHGARSYTSKLCPQSLLLSPPLKDKCGVEVETSLARVVGVDGMEVSLERNVVDRRGECCNLMSVLCVILPVCYSILGIDERLPHLAGSERGMIFTDVTFDLVGVTYVR
jgi:hypothetical protein